MINWNKIYERDGDFKILNQIFFERIMTRLRQKHDYTNWSPSSVIELGCGTGQALALMSNKFKDVENFSALGIDSSHAALNKARNRFKAENINNILLKNIDINEFETSNKYDLVFSKLVIAFIKDRPRFLKQVRKMMKEEAFFVLITPVLHDGVKYKPADKPNIGVNYSIIQQELKVEFADVQIFHHDYPDLKQDIVTFVCF